MDKFNLLHEAFSTFFNNQPDMIELQKLRTLDVAERVYVVCGNWSHLLW